MSAHDDADLIETMELEALKLCGLSRERAFAIDDMNIGAKYEDHVFFHLADVFYSKVFECQDENFRWVTIALVLINMRGKV